LRALQFINEITQDYHNNKSVTWGIIYKTNLNLLEQFVCGTFQKINTIAEVGYGLNPAFQNKGIMTELKCVIDYGFNELKLIKIEAFTHYKNESSKKLLEKLVFILWKTEKIKTMIQTVSMNF
jgi:ribosomal-protein-alanine N-acetyltransferase